MSPEEKKETPVETETSYNAQLVDAIFNVPPEEGEDDTPVEPGGKKGDEKDTAPEKEGAEKGSGPDEKDEAGDKAKGGKASDEKVPEPDAGLIARAAELGLSADDAKKLDESGLLEKTVRALDLQISAIGKKAAGEKPQDKPSGQKKPDEPEQPEPFKIELDPDLHDEDVVKTVQQMNDHYLGKIGEMNARLAQIEKERNAERAATFMREFDSQIEGLGKDFEEIFGKGPTPSLPKTAKEFENRAAVWKEMDALKAGYEATGRDVPGRDELFKRAVRVAFGDKHDTIARDRIHQQLRDEKGKFSHRPAGKSGRDERTPRQRMMDTAKAKMEELGIGEWDDEVPEKLA